MRGGGCLFEGISYTRLYGFCGYIVDSCRPKAAGRHESRRRYERFVRVRSIYQSWRLESLCAGGGYCAFQ